MSVVRRISGALAPCRLAPEALTRLVEFVHKLREASLNKRGALWKAAPVHAEHGFAMTRGRPWRLSADALW